MNNDILNYKYRFISFILLLGYAFIHFHLTGVYVDASFDKLIDFSARLPYIQRLLVPTLAHWISRIVPVDVNNLFFLIEWLFISLFYFTLLRLLRHEFKPRYAQLLSWLCLLLLPLMTVINYRFPLGGEATFFYPYDTATLFFMTAGFLFCLRSQWNYFIPWVFISTFNRETSLLLVLLIPTLHWQKCRIVIKPLLFATLAYFLARLIIIQLLHGMPGSFLEWSYGNSLYTHFEANLTWLLNNQNIIIVMFCFAGLPLFWFGFFDYIPPIYRPLRYLVLFYFLILLIVGNLVEARVFTEILVFLYLPVCVTLRDWVTEVKPISPVNPKISYYIDRYAVISVLIVIAASRFQLNKGLLWITQQ